MSLNRELAVLFHRLGQILEIKGVNQFKVIAFQKVGRVIEDLTTDVKQLCEQGKMREVEGIGESSCKIIEEYVKTGRSTDYDEVAASVPAGLLPMLQIPGLGPKSIALFWKERGITSMDELKKGLDDGSLVTIKGMGEKKIQSIRDGIALLSRGAGRMGIIDVLPIAEELVKRLREMKQVKQAEVAGSLRRRRETIGDVDLICAPQDVAGAAAISDAFTKFPEVERILGHGTTKASILTTGGLQVDLRIVPAENFGAALLYFTGSKAHNVRLRSLAQDKELTLNEWGLYKVSEYDRAAKKTGEAPVVKPVASKTEKDVYGKLGLAYIEPELREDRGEVEAAGGKALPSLISVEDLRGDLHSHTTASDGVASIAQMIEAAIARGYAFLAITDHSKSQTVANGLTAERLVAHVKEIHKVAQRYKEITVLAGSEVDILADGRLDYEDAVLAELDIVVASPHISLKQDTNKATSRMLRAIESRYVNIIGHPTGRLIDRREGLPLDFAPLFEAAAANGTALEINAGYPRLDLNETNARAAVAAGVMLAIDTDAHSTDALADMSWGINVARRGWIGKQHVINCRAPADLLKFLRKKR